MARVLMIVAPEKYRDEELEIPKKYFEDRGHKVEIASTRKGRCRGMLGGIIEAPLSLGDVVVEEYDAIVFVGGAGTPIVRKEPRALEIAKESALRGKVLAAICWAPTILAKAGVLRGKSATVWVGSDAEYGMGTDKVLEKFGGRYLREGVVVDGKIVTADGPSNAKAFAEAIARLLG